MKYCIFLFEDEKILRDEIAESIELPDVHIRSFESWKDYQNQSVCEQPHLSILDINLPGKNGLEIFQQLRNDFPQIEGIVITGQPDLENAITSLKIGASDYLQKPFRAHEINMAIDRRESYKQFRIKKDSATDELNNNKHIFEKHWGFSFLGRSKAIKEVHSLMQKVALANNTSVLITGESGCGKELVAKGIHSLSNRQSNPFFAINCTAIPDSLFESEFFGYMKGAFTGAHQNREGWFEIAHQGTLFLDEIGDINPHLQAKLLRVLDEKKVQRIGSSQAIKIDTRIISATNKDLKKMIDQGGFRLDLFHRLNSFTIHIPPLRERKEDIPLLTHHFTEHYSQLHKKNISCIHSKAIKMLINYDYPGNIRELKNIVERAILMCDSRILKPSHIDLELATTSTESGTMLQSYDLDQLEKETIIKAMHVSKHNKTQAAHILNITRQALNRKLKKYNL